MAGFARSDTEPFRASGFPQFTRRIVHPAPNSQHRNKEPHSQGGGERWSFRRPAEVEKGLGTDPQQSLGLAAEASRPHICLGYF